MTVPTVVVLVEDGKVIRARSADVAGWMAVVYTTPTLGRATLSGVDIEQCAVPTGDGEEGVLLMVADKALL